jgi:hypothetical protein
METSGRRVAATGVGGGRSAGEVSILCDSGAPNIRPELMASPSEPSVRRSEARAEDCLPISSVISPSRRSIVTIVRLVSSSSRSRLR